MDLLITNKNSAKMNLCVKNVEKCLKLAGLASKGQKHRKFYQLFLMKKNMIL
jgi:hypothetical protein